MKAINLLFMRKLIATRRNPVFIFMGLTTPVLYLALFAPLLKNIPFPHKPPHVDILNLFVPGMLTSLAFSSGFFAGFGVIDELRGGIIERFRVTPIHRFALLAGPILHDMLMTAINAILFIALAYPMGFRISFAGLILTFFLLMLLVGTTSSFGHAIGLITKNEDRLVPIVHGLNLPIMLLSGMMLPMQLAPCWLQRVAHFNPVYYVVEATRRLAIGELTDPMVGYAFLIMIPLTIGVGLWATRVFAKAVM